MTATVSAESGTPTGTVAFKDGDTELGTGTLDDGEATYSTESLSVDTHTITAEYAGYDDYEGSSSAAVDLVINGGVNYQFILPFIYRNGSAQ